MILSLSQYKKSYHILRNITFAVVVEMQLQSFSFMPYNYVAKGRVNCYNKNHVMTYILHNLYCAVAILFPYTFDIKVTVCDCFLPSHAAVIQHPRHIRQR
jgi:hypothetical protein